MKGSLNTFLNAMTYPDRTCYPVASCNLQDFNNLVDVYLDAVFHPRCVTNEKTFLQEGWHYELVGPATRGLHSSTFRLNVSNFCGTRLASKGCLGGFQEVLRGLGGWSRYILCQKRLNLGSEVDECKPLLGTQCGAVVIGCHVSQERGFNMRVDDAASNVCAAVLGGVGGG